MRIYTSESVSVGHPDKLADQISDALLDAFFENEAPELKGQTRVAVETLLTRGVAVVAGEVRTEGYVDVAKIVRETIASAGYTDTDFGFDGRTCGVLVAIQEQSADIAQGVDKNAAHKDVKRIGAGDQGMMFGYATRETDELMPLPLSISHALVRKSVEVRAEQSKSGKGPLLLPDAKSQVTLRFEEGKPAKATAIVVSTQHKHGYDKGEKQAELHAYVKDVVARVMPQQLLGNETVYHINPTGAFEIGGPDGDAGVTGRKIIVDTYGGAAPHGGGAFSGKDPTKVDRSAAYAARYLAKNIVAAGLAKRCTIQLAYAIGVSEPLSLYVDTHGTGTVGDEQIESAIGRIDKLGKLTPRGIRTHLGLNKPIYQATAAYGHFGRKPEGDSFPWERVDLVDDLKAAVAA
jgi:S-adenosylmethionine synthetase